MSDEQKKYAQIACCSHIEPIKPLNDEFTLCKVYVQGVGKNRNYSYMSKENILKAEPTIHYVPVVGHLMPKYDEDGNEVGKYFGGHDYVLDENWQMKALTVPFGVVTADPVVFEDVEEYGQTVPYMTATAILWTGRYPELKEAVYSDECWFNQSMELSVSQFRPYAEDSNYTELLDWTYSALCILGKSDEPEYHTEPCFISSRFVPLTYSESRDNFYADMSEMREHLAFILSPKKGGETPMNPENVQAVLAEYGLTTEMVDFEIEGMDEEALREAAQAFAEAHSAEGEADPEPADFVCEFAVTYNQRLDALRNALDDVAVRDGAGNVVSVTNYWVNDFDDAYVYVERYQWQRDGDSHEDHGRFAYAFNSDDLTASITGEFEEMFLMWLTNDEKQKLESSRSVFEELKQYKEANEKAKHKSAVDELFAQFADLEQVEGFDTLRQSAYESGEMEDLETKLYAMRGKMAKNFAKAPAKSTVRVGIDNTPSDANDETYGGLLRKW